MLPCTPPRRRNEQRGRVNGRVRVCSDCTGAADAAACAAAQSRTAAMLHARKTTGQMGCPRQRRSSLSHGLQIRGWCGAVLRMADDTLGGDDHGPSRPRIAQLGSVCVQFPTSLINGLGCEESGRGGATSGRLPMTTLQLPLGRLRGAAETPWFKCAGWTSLPCSPRTRTRVQTAPKPRT